MAKVKGIVLALLTMWFVWVMVSTVDVCVHNGNPNYEYSRANFYEVLLAIDAQIKSPTETKAVLVVDCTKYANGYEVVVRDLDGNDWAYIDSDYVCPNEVIEVVFDGENRIVDVKEGE